MKKILLSSVILFASLSVLSQTDEESQFEPIVTIDTTHKKVDTIDIVQFKKNVKTLAKVSGKGAAKIKSGINTYFVKPFTEGYKEEKQKKH